jgi:hypothetical protein
MSDKENPELVEENELDAVSGGGCCGDDEQEKWPCVRNYDDTQYNPTKCKDCRHLRKTQEAIGFRYYCNLH